MGRDSEELLKLLKKADEFFEEGIYDRALYYYSLALQKKPKSEEAKIGALLCDLAKDSEEEAHILYDYYLVLKSEGFKNKAQVIERLITSFEKEEEEIFNIFSLLDSEEGIRYNDFKKLIRERVNFRRAFEDIMFSTKVVIDNKKDFLDFLENLINNGFKEIALMYLEEASYLYPNEVRFQELFEKLDYL